MADDELRDHRVRPSDRRCGPRTVDRNLEVPAEALEDAELLQMWAERAAAATR